ncbi:hypothetical protein K7X08_004796 [Anisodus acutangulus]|uniref:Uncharacterized protein n=1 Tax=Anisodus acutangulus TaxID=402998 RepID=A0A9Q1RIU7_9SOLA|nr:hypothetical protein K7X08_004796 [Anisodus acutangulus]
MSSKKEAEEIDTLFASNGNTSIINETGLHLYPVSANDSGEGLPYAPVDWPNAGDKWGWRAWRRAIHIQDTLEIDIYYALRAYMAGTVGGSSSLDAEYFCRYCDSRTDLVSRALKLLNVCTSVASRADIEKILNVLAFVFYVAYKKGVENSCCIVLNQSWQRYS